MNSNRSKNQPARRYVTNDDIRRDGLKCIGCGRTDHTHPVGCPAVARARAALREVEMNDKDMLHKLHEACRDHLTVMFRYSLGKLTEDEVDKVNRSFVDAVFEAGRHLDPKHRRD